MEREEIIEIINECMRELVGDMPVPYQLDAALEGHVHEQYALKTELNTLKKEVERISNLVGDTSVAEQLNAILNR